MAIDKNNYIDCYVNYDLKKSLVDEVIDEFNSTSSDLNAHKAENAITGNPHGMPSVISGSTVINMTTAATSAKLFGLGELRTAFNNNGVSSGGLTENYFAIVNNGDANVSSVHMDGVSWSGGDMHVTFDRSISGYIRVNYMVFYKR